MDKKMFPPPGMGKRMGPPPNGEKFGPPPPMNTYFLKRKWINLTYANQSPAQKLDIYLPNEGTGPFPVIVSIHGGAWMFGDKGDTMNLPVVNCTENGYAAVCINYRLSGEAIFPAQIYDCKAAIRFIRANAAKYLLDGAHIATWGGSAGGHLSALLGTSAGVKELEDFSMGNSDSSSEVQAVVDWCGPTENFIEMDKEFQKSHIGPADHSVANSPESQLLGKKITEVPDLVKKASPMTYITDRVPPILIQHGEADPVVPVQQSINFTAELTRIAGQERVTLELLPGVGHHGDPAFETDQNIHRVKKFLDACLKNS